MILATYFRDVYNRQLAALQRYGVTLEDPADEPITLEDARKHCRVDTFEVEGDPPTTASDDDEWLTDIGIPAAREFCEAELGRSLAPRTVRLVSSAFPSVAVEAAAGAAMPLPYGPVQSITEITYLSQTAYDAAYDAAYDTAYQTAYDEEFGSSADPVAADAAGIAAGEAAGEAAGDAALEVTMPAEDYVLDSTTVPARLLLAYGASWPTGLRTAADAVRVEYLAGFNLYDESPQVFPLPKLARAAMAVMLAHLYVHRGDEAVETPPAVKALLARVRGRETVPFA